MTNLWKAISKNVPAQTFTIDPASVKMAEQVNLTSIDLYFKSKPTSVGNKSGVTDPGVNVYIVPTAAGGIPNYGSTLDNFVFSRKEFSEIVSSIDASVTTKFTFTAPIPVKTGVEYAIIVKPDFGDTSFSLWAATQGEINIANKQASSGIAGKYQGKYFELSGTDVNWQPLPYKNLKFRVYVARYAYDGEIPAGSFPRFELNMKNYEFVTFNKCVGTFLNGEYVYKKPASADGTVSVISGTNIATTSGGAFSSLFATSGDDSFLIVEDTSNQNVRKVIEVSNDGNTLHVDKPFSFTNTSSNFYRTAVATVYVNKSGSLLTGAQNFIILSDSNANSTVRFSNNCTLVGETTGTTVSNAYFNDLLVHSSDPHTYVYAPPKTSFAVRQEFGYTSNDGGETGVVSYPAPSFNVKLYSPNNLDIAGQPIMLKSRSNEVDLQSWPATHKGISSKMVFDIISTNDYSSPQIDYNATDVFFTRYIINNDATNEHTKLGNALSKHITSKVSFDKGRQAEDLIAYVQAYKPAGTDIKVYAKIHNSEDTDYFDDKDWTELVETSESRYSSSSNLLDFVEYTYGFKSFPDEDHSVPGYVSIASNSTTITAASSATDFTDPTNGLSAGDLVKIYSQLFPEKYVVYSVYSVDSATQITLNTPISSTDATALGTSSLVVAKLALPHQAFINARNSNTVRYFNSNMTIFDKYDTFSLKIVFLSDSQYIIPKISNIRAVGVSA